MPLGESHGPRPRPDEVAIVDGLAGVTVAILAGGQGTRLRPRVADRPKVLAEIRGRPFLAYLLDQVVDAGVSLVVLCTGYMGEQVYGTFGDTYRDLQLVYSQEPLPLGTGGSLRFALPLFKSDTVLVMNGDSICEADLRGYFSWHCSRGAQATMLLAEASDTERYGRVEADAAGVVLTFVEKGGNPGPGLINAGMYLIDRRLLLTIPTNGTVSLEREVLPSWIGRGLYAYRSGGRFLDIGTPDAFAAAGQFFSRRTETGRSAE